MSDADDKGLKGRPFVSLFWECCQVYTRVYRDKGGTFYEGRCPKCLRTARLVVGAEGTSSRAFRVK